MKRLAYLLLLFFSVTPAFATFPTIAQQGSFITILNDPVRGTTLNTLVSLTGTPSAGRITPAGSLSGSIGVAIGGVGTQNAVVVQQSGQVNCVFDGGTTAGDYVQISASIDGNCHDTGSQTAPTAGQIIGNVLSTNSGAGLYTVLLTIGSYGAPNAGGIIGVTGGGTGTNYGPASVNIQLPNSGTGTVLNKVAIVTSAGTAQIAPAGATSGVAGICVANCGNAGTATIQIAGSTPCIFTTGITSGDYVQVDASVAGECVDSGTTFPTSGGAILGTVISATSVTVGTYNISLAPPVPALTLGNALLKTNNLSDLTSVSTAQTNLGLGTAALQPLPTVGVPGNFAPLEQTLNHALSITSASVTCSATTGVYPFEDYYTGSLNGNNVTYTLPTSGCVDNSEIVFNITQDGGHTVTFTTSAAGGIAGTCPAIGSSVGNQQTTIFQWIAATSVWFESCPGASGTAAGPAGGSLAGTYPNPTISVIDAGVNAPTSRSNLGLGSAALLNQPVLGNVTGFEATQQGLNHTLPTSSASVVCTESAGGIYPSFDWYSGNLSGANVTYTLPTSGCVDNSVIGFTPVQDAAHTVSWATSAPGGIEGGSCPALGTSAGNQQSVYYQYNLARTSWVTHCAGNVPSVGFTVPVGGTGAATLTAHGVLLGQGTSPITAVSPWTSGQALLGSGGSADPAPGAVNLAGGSSIVTGLLPIANGSTGATTLKGANLGVILLQEYNSISQVATVSTAYDLLNSGSSGFTIPGGTIVGKHGIDLIMQGAYLNATSSDDPNFSVLFGGGFIVNTILGTALGTNATLPRGWVMSCHIEGSTAGTAETGYCAIAIAPYVANSVWTTGTPLIGGSSSPSMTVDGTANQTLRVQYTDPDSGNSTIKVFFSRVTAW